MKYIGILLVIMALTVLTSLVIASDYGYLTSAELKTMIDRNEPGLVLIDSRSRREYEEAHIKGAIIIPLSEMEQDSTLPKVPKDAKLVFYCSGST